MAVNDSGTYYDLTDAETKQAWEREVLYQVVKRATLLNPKYGLIGDKNSSMIHRRRKTFNSSEDGGGGTQATTTLIRNYRQTPAIGNEPLRGSEEGLGSSTFRYQINQLRHAGQLNGVRITKQRVPWNVWNEMMNQESLYWPAIIEAGLCMHLAGFTVNGATQSEWYHRGDLLAHTLCNAPRTPDTKHIFRPNGLADDAAVHADSTAVIDIDLGSRLKSMAQSMPVPMRPCSTPWGDLYVFLCHTYSLNYLRRTYSAWWQTMTAALKGGVTSDNPIFTGALGIFDEVLYVQAQYIPPGFVGNTIYRNCRRNVFCGAQAAVLGFAKENEDENTFTAEVDGWDYNNNKGLANAIMIGAASPYFTLDEQGTTEDYGKIVVPTYAEELVVSA